MRVHAVQLAYGDDEPMADRVRRVVNLVAALAGADLVVLPELWAPGGFDHRSWAAHAQPLDGPVMTAIGEVAAKTGMAVHAGSLIERDGDALWNTSVLFGPDGTRLASYRKIHRFGFGEGEPVLLAPGEHVVTAPLAVDGRSVTVGLATCYDLRFPEMFRLLLDAGAELVVVPAAWPAARVEHWRLLGRARAVENQTVMIQCNTAGTHAGVPMGGHSQVVAATGEVLAEAGTGETVLTADIDLDAVAAWRRQFPVLADRRL